MAHTVVGIFENASDAQHAVQELLRRGFSDQQVDLTSRNTDRAADRDDDEEAGENAITRFFKSLFGSDDEADRYSKVARRSGTVVTVHASSEEEAEQAADILDDYDAVDVDKRYAEYNDAAPHRYEHTAPVADDRNDVYDRENVAGDRIAEEEKTFPVVEENVRVDKRTVEKGGLRIRSRIVEKPVEETMRLREEQVWVERNPVNRPADADELENFREGAVEIKEHAEVPVVNKEARVVEEVRVGKTVEEHDEEIRDTARKTDIDIENLERRDVNAENRGQESQSRGRYPSEDRDFL